MKRLKLSNSISWKLEFMNGKFSLSEVYFYFYFYYLTWSFSPKKEKKKKKTNKRQKQKGFMIILEGKGLCPTAIRKWNVFYYV